MIFYFLFFLRGKIPVRVTASRLELTSQRQKVSKLPPESPEELFLTCGVLVANPKKLLILHDGQYRSWSAVQGKENKRKESSSAPPPTLHAARSEKKKNTLRIYRRYAGFGPSRVHTWISSTRQLGQGCCFAKFYAIILPCAITSFPVSLPLSSPGYRYV